MRYDGVYLSIMYMMILFRGAKWQVIRVYDVWWWKLVRP